MSIITAVANTLSTVTITAIASLSLSSDAQTFIGNFTAAWGSPDAGQNTHPIYAIEDNTFICGSFRGVTTGANKLTFIGNQTSTPISSLFKIGDLTYFNGIVESGTNVYSVPLNILLSFTAPTSFSQIFHLDFNFVSTPNTGTIEQNADSLFLKSSFDQQSFSFGGSDYTVKLTGFSQDGGATSVEQLRALEGASTTASLYGVISVKSPTIEPPTIEPPTIEPPAVDIPEPTAITGLSVIGIYFIAHRRLGKQK